MTTTVMPPSQEVLTDCVRLATAAPSLHNSQPWLFRIGPSAIDVYADRNRRLPVLDPAGREQLISVAQAEPYAPIYAQLRREAPFALAADAE